MPPAHLGLSTPPLMTPDSGPDTGRDVKIPACRELVAILGDTALTPHEWENTALGVCSYWTLVFNSYCLETVRIINVQS